MVECIMQVYGDRNITSVNSTTTRVVGPVYIVVAVRDGDTGEVCEFIAGFVWSGTQVCSPSCPCSNERRHPQLRHSQREPNTITSDQQLQTAVPTKLSLTGCLVCFVVNVSVGNSTSVYTNVTFTCMERPYVEPRGTGSMLALA